MLEASKHGFSVEDAKLALVCSWIAGYISSLDLSPV